MAYVNPASDTSTVERAIARRIVAERDRFCKVTIVGIVAGYLEDDGDGGVGLSAKGQRWYDRDLLRRE